MTRSVSSIDKKRKYRQAYGNSGTMLSPGQTAVKVLVSRVIKPASPKGPHRIVCNVMQKDGAFILFAKKKKSEDEDGSMETADETSSHVSDPTNNPAVGVSMEYGKEYFVSSFSNDIGQVKVGHIVTLAISASMWNDRPTFKADKIMPEIGDSSVLCKSVYERFIKGSFAAEIPTKFNILPEMFPEGADVEWMRRPFVLPLSNDMKMFSDILLLSVDEEVTKKTNMCLTSEKKGQAVGFNRCVGEGSESRFMNQLQVVYEPLDTSKPAVIMNFTALMPEENQLSIYSVFGITDLDMWANVGIRLAASAKEWFTFGFSSRSHVLRVMGGTSGGADESAAGNDYGDYGAEHDTNDVPSDQITDVDEDIVTTGVMTKMGLNLQATIREAGIEVPHDYVEEFFSSYTYDAVVTNHPINMGYKMKITREVTGTILNLTEMQDMIIPNTLSLLKGKKVKFYAIFATGTNAPYECEDQEAAVSLLKEKKEEIKPSVIYAILE